MASYRTALKDDAPVTGAKFKPSTDATTSLTSSGILQVSPGSPTDKPQSLMIFGENMAEYRVNASAGDLSQGEMHGTAQFLKISGYSGQSKKEIWNNEYIANQHAKTVEPAVVDEDEEPKHKSSLKFPSLLAESAAAGTVLHHHHRHHGWLKYRAIRALKRGIDAFHEKLHEEPKPKERVNEKEKLKLETEGAALRDAKGAEGLARDTKMLGQLGSDAGKLTRLTSELGIAAREAAVVGHSLWEGSKLIRFGAAVAAGTGAVAAGLVSAPILIGAAVVVGTVAAGAGAIAYAYKGNTNSAIATSANWLWSGVKTAASVIIPFPDAEARAQFAQGHILTGLDQTFGISAGIHAVKIVGQATKNAVIATVNDPQKAMANLTATGKLVSDLVTTRETRDAGGKLIGAYVTGEDTKAPLMGFAMAGYQKPAIKAQITALQPFVSSLASSAHSLEDDQLVATSGGSSDARRPKLAASGAIPEFAPA